MDTRRSAEAGLDYCGQDLGAGGMTSFDDLSEPELTSFQVSQFQRERDVIEYCGQILDDLGGDDGPNLTTLPQILLRIRRKIATIKMFEEGYE